MTPYFNVVENHTNLLNRQFHLRKKLAEPIVVFLQSLLIREVGVQAEIKLYGSLHHGLFVEGYSKINLDIVCPEGHQHIQNHVLQILASLLQQEPGKISMIPKEVKAPVLIHNKTVERPYILSFLWLGVPVFVTAGNSAGIAVSNAMFRVLATNPMLRMVMMTYKMLLRTQTNLLGPNAGQVSTYAILTIIVHRLAKRSLSSSDYREFEKRVRQEIIEHLQSAPRLPYTCDLLNKDLNLTAQSYRARELVQYLQQM